MIWGGKTCPRRECEKEKFGFLLFPFGKKKISCPIKFFLPIQTARSGTYRNVLPGNMCIPRLLLKITTCNHGHNKIAKCLYSYLHLTCLNQTLSPKQTSAQATTRTVSKPFFQFKHFLFEIDFLLHLMLGLHNYWNIAIRNSTKQILTWFMQIHYRSARVLTLLIKIKFLLYGENLRHFKILLLKNYPLN